MQRVRKPGKIIENKVSTDPMERTITIRQTVQFASKWLAIISLVAIFVDVFATAGTETPMFPIHPLIALMLLIGSTGFYLMTKCPYVELPVKRDTSFETLDKQVQEAFVRARKGKGLFGIDNPLEIRSNPVERKNG